MADILNVPTTMRVGDGKGGYATGSIGEVIAQEVKNDSVANYMTSLANVEWIGNTLVRIRYKMLPKSNFYGDGSTPAQRAQILEKDQAINKFRTIKVKFETFDEIALQKDLGFQAWVVNMIAESVKLDQAGLYFTSYLNMLAQHPENQIALPNFATTDTLSADDSRSDTRKFANFIAKIQKIYNTIIRGADKEAIVSILDTYAYNNRLLGLTYGNNGDSAISKLQEGKLNPEKIWGQNILVNDLLNNVIPRDISFSEDYDVDTLNTPAIMSYRGAVALPTKIFSAMSVYDPIDGNPVVIVKYKYDFIEIYPELCLGVVKVASTQPIQPNWVFIQGGDIVANSTATITRGVVINPFNADQTAYTVASDNVGVASVVKGTNTIVITPVSNGTANITITSTVDSTKTFTLPITVNL